MYLHLLKYFWLLKWSNNVWIIYQIFTGRCPLGEVHFTDFFNSVKLMIDLFMDALGIIWKILKTVLIESIIFYCSKTEERAIRGGTFILGSSVVASFMCFTMCGIFAIIVLSSHYKNVHIVNLTASTKCWEYMILG